MQTSIFSLKPILAQAPSPKVANPKAVKPKIVVPPPSSPSDEANNQSWLMVPTGGLFILLIVLAIKSHLIVKELERTIRIEKLKNKEIHKRLKLAAESITKMEKNPDLIHSRDFNLDYLRLRMAEE
ncbi:MAG: hypothetical protein VKJ46_10940, partial [Leptolyngbyaceae bacterium]|nr:hypothetical protein [Leptolyngbyaceae bacterium]